MARKKPAPAAKSASKDDKPKRVCLKNAKSANGEIGGIANPLAKDIDAWLAKGWVRA